jgi:hypothetical protein
MDSRRTYENYDIVKKMILIAFRFDENDENSGSKTDRNKRKPSFTIPIDLLGKRKIEIKE